jgi:hypothetical protein
VGEVVTVPGQLLGAWCARMYVVAIEPLSCQ